MILLERKVAGKWELLVKYKRLSKADIDEVNMLRDKHGMENIRCRRTPSGVIIYVPLPVERFPYQVQQRNGRWVFKMLTRDEASKLIAKSMGLDVK